MPKTVDVTLPPLHAIQQEVFDSPARFRVLVAGRRCGKSRYAATESIKALLAGKNVWWVSPTFDISKRVGWKMVARAMRPIIQSKLAEMNRSDLRITMHNGGEFQAKSADHPDKLVGEGLDLIIIDEAGIVQESAWVESLRPALSDRLGKAIFIGTPKGRNWFWNCYNRGLDPEEADWQSWRVPTSANPYIVPAEIESARRDQPERTFKQEYLAEFLEDGGAVFRNVRGCVKPPTDAPGPYVFGVDWGRHNDYTVIAVMCKTSRKLVAIDRFNQIGWHLQRGRLSGMAEKWKPDSILAETNSIGEPNIEQLQREGLPVQGFTTTSASKGPLIEELALDFEQGNIGILDDPVLLNELEAYELERLPGGMFRYSAPAGAHDDCVIALALARRAANLFRARVIHRRTV